MIAETLLVWSLASGRVEPADGAAAARPVGSLAKAFVLEAWGRTHPDAAAPAGFTCQPGSCWLAPGHGPLDLPGATAASCNSYFQALAASTPREALEEAFRRHGFTVPAPLDAATAIGLGSLGKLPRISPAHLLRAYRALATVPWPAHDDLRLAWLAGMARAGREGTGKGIGLRGLLVKTGTVPSLTGLAAGTSGWALALDPAGTTAHLALLPDGTGALAAEGLGAHLLRLGRAATARDRRRSRVAIRLFPHLAPDRIVAENVAGAPLPLVRGRTERLVGPGGSVVLEPGDRLGEGRFTLSLSPYGLVRAMTGTLEVSRTSPTSLTLATSTRAWVEGLVRGELPAAPPGRQEELGAAALRFLAEGPRHGSADVCDSTHCARFVGHGPPVTWTTPTSARILPASADPFGGFSDAAWERIEAAAREPGPSRFTGHCGGEPLSPFAVWGRGTHEAQACPRHGPGGDTAAWSRFLPDAALAAALGGEVTGLTATSRGGVRRTRVVVAGRTRELLYDELHRLLAPRLGWDALPAPPDSYARTGTGFLAQGQGRGHRVGLCLAD